MSNWLRTLLITLAALLVPVAAWATEPMLFVHPPPETANDQRHSYYWEILEAALQVSRDRYGDYKVVSYGTAMNFPRAVAELESGDAGRVNIVARATNLDLETRLRPIPLPLDKGLLGYRLFLIMPGLQERLDKVRTLDDLRRFSIGQATAWTDVKILLASHFNVVQSNDYEGLFQMLAAGRFDLFSRGVNEIDQEWDARRLKIPGMTIENSLVLHYPMPRYFFVPRTAQGARMAERIELGLRRLAQSGEFERRYQSYKKLVLADLNLAGRRVFRLANPQLSALAPTGEAFWWDDLALELAPKR